MKRLFVFHFLLVLNVYHLFAQKVELYVGSGIASTTMSDLKAIQNYQLSSMIVPAKMAADFPVTFQYLGEVKVEYNQFWFGFHYSFLSTGSRIGYSDYSGVLTSDIICNSHQFGPFATYTFHHWGKLDFNGFLGASFIASMVMFKDYIAINNVAKSDHLDVYSTSLSLLPGTELTYTASIFKLAFRVSYQIDGGAPLHEKNKVDNVLYGPNGEKVKTNWSGVHIELLFGVKL